ncbi:MAG: hypothetical protein IKR61_02995 [Lachnospiraceae bacterium]|nr:hypothetical protein [Lachnospiraceae bacterium]
MDEIQRRETMEAVEAADIAIRHLEEARRCLGSAGNWGLFDLFGGGALSGLIKHSKMENAEREIQEAKYALERFSRELRDVSGFSSVHVDSFLTFADFFFDGLIADWLVQSKISKAKKQVDDAIHQVQMIRGQLLQSLNANDRGW